MAFAEMIFASRFHQIHTVDREVELTALRLFKRYHDHDLSFTDCTTLVFLDQLSIHQIFAYDQVFKNVGYHLVPGFSS